MTPGRIGVLVVVAAAIAFSAVYFVKALDHSDAQATANSALSYADRDVAGGNSIIVDQGAAYEARALIPSTSTYRVVTGGTVKDATALTAPFVDAWFRYFLMPRRPAADAHWIICYACDVGKLGGPYKVRWQDDNGISIGQLG
jgi:hypothetical protein